jgi:hypothetical protein
VDVHVLAFLDVRADTNDQVRVLLEEILAADVAIVGSC